jgi:uncharacterized protein (DUF433 family)
VATERLESTGQADDLSAEEWVAQRVSDALLILRDTVEIDPDKCGGVPVLRSTRLTVARLLAELADGRSVGAIAEDFELDPAIPEDLLRNLSQWLDRPAIR